MSDSQTDVSELARKVVDELEDTRQIGDQILLSRREAIALSTGAISLGALGVAASGSASAQEAVGQVGTEADPVDIEAAQGNFSQGVAVDGALEAGLVSTDEASINGPLYAESATVGVLNNTHYVVDGDDIADEVSIADSNNRSIVMVAPGTYPITANLNIPAGVSLIGSGIGESVINSDGTDSVRLDEPNTMLKGFTVETAKTEDFSGTVDIRGGSDNKMRIVTECEVRNTAESNGANGINVNDTSGSAWIVYNLATSVMENGIRTRESSDECIVFGNMVDSIRVSSQTKPVPASDFNHTVL